MAESTDRQHLLSDKGALAALSPADQPALAQTPDEPNPADTTSILQGSQAFLGKAAWSAGRMALSVDPFGLYAAAKKTREREDLAAQEARELANLARWNTEKISVGGVEMTNAEAQAARQHVIDHDDAYADRLIAQGKLHEDERDDFKQAVRRKQELEDKRGRGTLTDGEAEEERRLDRTRVGQAVDTATAQAYQDRGPGHTARLEDHSANANLRRSSGAEDSDAVFQAYATAKVASREQKPPLPVADKVKAVGLDL